MQSNRHVSRHETSVNRCFAWTCHLHLQGRISRVGNQCESRWQSEQSACRNYQLRKRKERNRRYKFSSYWLARGTWWAATSASGPHTRRREPTEPGAWYPEDTHELSDGAFCLHVHGKRPEDWGRRFFRNLGAHLQDDKASETSVPISKTTRRLKPRCPSPRRQDVWNLGANLQDDKASETSVPISKTTRRLKPRCPSPRRQGVWNLGAHLQDDKASETSAPISKTTRRNIWDRTLRDVPAYQQKRTTYCPLQCPHCPSYQQTASQHVKYNTGLHMISIWERGSLNRVQTKTSKLNIWCYTSKPTNLMLVIFSFTNSPCPHVCSALLIRTCQPYYGQVCNITRIMCA
jgi:hypothetical protein